MPAESPAQAFGAALCTLRKSCCDPASGRALSQARLADLLGEELGTPGSPSGSAVGYWERGETYIDARERKTLLALVRIFARLGALLLPEAADAFLLRGGYAPLGQDERTAIFPGVPATPAPLAPPARDASVWFRLWDAIPARDRATPAALASYAFRRATDAVSWRTGLLLIVAILTYVVERSFLAWPYADAGAAWTGSGALLLGLVCLPVGLAAAVEPEGLEGMARDTPEARRAEIWLRWAGAQAGYVTTATGTWLIALALWHLGAWPLGNWFWLPWFAAWLLLAVVTTRVMTGQFAHGRGALVVRPVDRQVGVGLLAGGLILVAIWGALYPIFLSEPGAWGLLLGSLAVVVIEAWRAWRKKKGRDSSRP
jgi:hypothetical protein